MKTAGSPPLSPPPLQDITTGQGLAREAARDLAVVAAGVLVFAAGMVWAAGLGLQYPLKALLAYSLGAWLVWRGLRAHPHRRFGAANRITLLRMGSVALFAALAGEPLPRGPLDSMPTVAWWLALVAAATALLDAVDGALARRSGLASEFGARFDMETDAAFTAVLCVLVLQAGQAGAWVLASGAMRYAFVAAARLCPWLNGPLQPSKRRQAVCVVQIGTLIVCLMPVVPALAATVLAAISLVLLTLSFAIDVRTLAQQRPTPPEN